MKTVLIITSKSEKTVAWKERQQYIEAFCREVERQLDDTRVIYTVYDELEFSVMNGQCKIYDAWHELDLRDADFVQFKNWAYSWGDASVAAHYLAERGVPFVNPEVDIALAPGKLSQMFLLGSDGVPVPDTFYARKRRLQQLFSANKLPAGFDFPLIMKANDGSRGDDNHLIKSFEQAVDILTAAAPEKEYVLQQYVPNEGDYRILYVGTETPPLAFLRSAAAGSHLNNTSKGGAGSFIDAQTLPPEFLKHARRAARLMGREIAGVDIIVDKNNGDAFILEVNGTPALATGYGVDNKTARFADLARQILEGTATPPQQTRIGRAERVQLPEHTEQWVPAKIDTGADLSSIWASNITEKGGKLSFYLFGKDSQWFNGKKLTFSGGNYRRTRIASSFGDRQYRYVVKLTLCLAGRTVRASFSLADRSAKTYPILIGRRLLNRKFIVDVSRGNPLLDEEKAKRKRMRLALKDRED